MKQPVLVSARVSSSVGLGQPKPLNSDVVSDDLVHELRQPLGAIEALAYYLELTSTDEKTRYQAQQIQVMVNKANRILSNASASDSAPAKPAVLTRSAVS